MNGKAIAAWTVVAFVVWLVIRNPHTASEVIAHIGSFVSTSINGLARFVASI